jgi:hypothetical protein
MSGFLLLSDVSLGWVGSDLFGLGLLLVFSRTFNQLRPCSKVRSLQVPSYSLYDFIQSEHKKKAGSAILMRHPNRRFSTTTIRRMSKQTID